MINNYIAFYKHGRFKYVLNLKIIFNYISMKIKSVIALQLKQNPWLQKISYCA